MKKNMGRTDQNIRIALAIIIAFLYFTDFISGTLALLLVVLASIFVITSSIKFCPLYFPFGINTRPKNEVNEKNQ